MGDNSKEAVPGARRPRVGVEVARRALREVAATRCRHSEVVLECETERRNRGVIAVAMHAVEDAPQSCTLRVGHSSDASFFCCPHIIEGSFFFCSGLSVLSSQLAHGVQSRDGVLFLAWPWSRRWLFVAGDALIGHRAESRHHGVSVQCEELVHNGRGFECRSVENSPTTRWRLQLWPCRWTSVKSRRRWPRTCTVW